MRTSCSPTSPRCAVAAPEPVAAEPSATEPEVIGRKVDDKDKEKDKDKESK